MIINSNEIKKAFIGSENVEKIIYQGATIWQYHYGVNTELIFSGNSGTLEIARLPKEITSSIMGQTVKNYEENGIYFQAMWSPYEDKHQFYMGIPTSGVSVSMLSDFVSQAPNNYSINTGNIGGYLDTRIIDNGTKLQFTYTDTKFLNTWQSLPVKFVKFKFKL